MIESKVILLIPYLLGIISSNFHEVNPSLQKYFDKFIVLFSQYFIGIFLSTVYFNQKKKNRILENIFKRMNSRNNYVAIEAIEEFRIFCDKTKKGEFILENLSFIGSNWKNSNISDFKFKNCYFERINFKNSLRKNTKFIDCNFKSININDELQLN